MASTERGWGEDTTLTTVTMTAHDAALLDRLLDIDTALRQLHGERRFSGDGYGWTVCAECRQSYPCQTIKVMNGCGD